MGVGVINAQYSACPSGNPFKAQCATCSQLGAYSPCPLGGCYPTSGYKIVGGCGNNSTQKVICGYCTSNTATKDIIQSCTFNSQQDTVSYNIICSSSTTTGSSSSSSGCFSGFETLTLESGALVTMDKVQIGDKVMMSSEDGKTFFSPVIVIPHPLNFDDALFVRIITNSNRDIKTTTNHLIMSGKCGGKHSLKESGSLKVGDCVATINGDEVITTHTTLHGRGIYTVVTASDQNLVVNGIIASPFASNHLVANSFYNIHRAVYKYAPWFTSHFVMTKAVKEFGDMITAAFSH